MKKTLSIPVAVALLVACGRPSTSNRFSFDGVGEPRIPEGNIILGKYAGNIEVTRWKTPFADYQSLTGEDLPLVQSIFNSTEIEGLGGLQLLVINTQPPMKLGDPRLGGSPCYIDKGAFPQLGGNLDTVDVGDEFRLEWNGGGAGNRHRAERDADDAYQNPQADLIFYVSSFTSTNLILPDDDDLDLVWEGGTLAGRGYEVAPPQELQEVLHFPAEVFGPGGTTEPTLNGTPIGADPIAPASQYLIEWEPATNTENLVGMNITVQLYGPANLGSETSPQVNALPYFNRLASLVCTVDDADGDFTLLQSDLDNLLAVARTTQAYANSTEDVNGDGECTPLTPSPTGSNGEDGNQDGDCDDKIYGAALIINRRTENVFTATLNDGPAPVYISGNATKYYPMSWAPSE